MQPPETARPGTEPAVWPPAPIRARLSKAQGRRVRQLITVDVDGWGSNRATVQAWTRWRDEWYLDLPATTGWVGPNGLTVTPSEADDYTPAGVYAITMLFGTEPDPGCHLSYRLITGRDYWVDDPDSPLYNTFQTGKPKGRWRSAERLRMYEHAVAFDYNTDPVLPGRNSAIFLHDGGPSDSAGCITVAMPDLVDLMCWMLPEMHPHIALGVDLPPASQIVRGEPVVPTDPEQMVRAALSAASSQRRRREWSSRERPSGRLIPRSDPVAAAEARADRDAAEAAAGGGQPALFERWDLDDDDDLYLRSLYPVEHEATPDEEPDQEPDEEPGAVSVRALPAGAGSHRRPWGDRDRAEDTTREEARAAHGQGLARDITASTDPADRTTRPGTAGSDTECGAAGPAGDRWARLVAANGGPLRHGPAAGS